MLLRDATEIQVSAWFVGTRLDLRSLERGETVALAPLTVRAGERGYAMLFRYGTVVFIHLNPMEEAAFLDTLTPFISGRVDDPEHEVAMISIDPERTEHADAEGNLIVHEASLERLQIVAHILAKSTVLAYCEERVAAVFDRIERLAEELQQGAIHRTPEQELLRQIGDVLLMQSSTTGRVEITEKPDSTWDDPEIDRLYVRLAAEYELHERDLALSRKLDVVSRTVQAYLGLLQNRQSLRVEWYIVILILVSIVLAVYDLFFTS